MKKIINGKVYDTASAKLVGEWDNGRYGRDFGRCAEELYQKRTGEFFLHGSGGASISSSIPAPVFAETSCAVSGISPRS